MQGTRQAQLLPWLWQTHTLIQSIQMELWCRRCNEVVIRYLSHCSLPQQYNPTSSSNLHQCQQVAVVRFFFFTPLRKTLWFYESNLKGKPMNFYLVKQSDVCLQSNHGYCLENAGLYEIWPFLDYDTCKQYFGFVLFVLLFHNQGGILIINFGGE